MAAMTTTPPDDDLGAPGPGAGDPDDARPAGAGGGGEPPPLPPPPDPPDPPPASGPPPPLDPPVGPPPGPARRTRGLSRSADRYAGGVAGGLAHALDVDPIIVRLALVLGTLYLPWLILLYALGWLVLPDERTGSSLVRAARGHDGLRTIGGILLLAVGAVSLAPDLGPGGDSALTLGVVLVGLGILLVLRSPGDDLPPTAVPAPPWRSGPPGPDPAATEPDDPAASVDRPGPPLARLVRRQGERSRRAGSHLGWLGLSLLVVLAGVVAAVDRGIEPVKPGVAVSLGLVLVGAVLVVAAWRGRARLLIPFGLLLLPLWVGVVLPDVPRYDHDGEVTYVAREPAELRRSYDHGFGTMHVDLQDLALEPGEHRTVHIGLDGGTATVRVPRDAEVRVDGDIGLGQVEIFQWPYYGRIADSGPVAGRTHLGPSRLRATCLRQDVYDDPGYDAQGQPLAPKVTGHQYVTPYGERCTPKRAPKDPPVLRLRLDVGIGSVEVRREAP
jgi:phage shock protein PspC (stress-responsive transcriptional regulator)